MTKGGVVFEAHAAIAEYSRKAEKEVLDTVKTRKTHTSKDGRLIMGQEDYRLLRMSVWVNQGGCCADCGSRVAFGFMELHHIEGRGMAGSKRDDRPDKCKGVCQRCHKDYEGGVLKA